MNFSIYKVSSPKQFIASAFAVEYPFKNSSLLKAILIPFPPPPAAALIITGNPISLAISKACSSLSIIPSYPGAIGTPASLMVSLALALFPIRSIDS
ncbi:hypothetical protein D3C76_482680 [compost metagenome]